jgi:hypothetical protein
MGGFALMQNEPLAVEIAQAVVEAPSLQRAGHAEDAHRLVRYAQERSSAGAPV